MTTPLFKEALIESKRLREIASEEAKQAVLESISPLIKQMLDKEIAGVGLLFEEEETDPLAPPTDSITAAPTDATTPPTDTATTPPVAAPMDMASPMAAPIPTAAGGMNIPMPGPDGKITVDIEDLFQSTPEDQEPVVTGGAATPPADLGAGAVTTPEVPAATPAPEAALAGETPIPGGEEVPPAEENKPPAITEHSSFKKELSFLEKRLEECIRDNSVSSSFVREATQNKLFGLYESLEVLRASGKINSTIASLEEGRLELLYSRLQETAKEVNSYSGQSKKELNMSTKSLKAFAKALFEEASAGFGDDGEASEKIINSNEKEKPSNHAMKASKSTPVEDPGKKASLTVSESLEEEEMMKLENELKEMFGTMEEEEMNDTPSEEEGAMPMMEDAYEEEEEVKKEALSRKLKALKEQTRKIQKELAECGMGGGTPVNVNITVDTGEGAEVHGLGGEEEVEEPTEPMGDNDLGSLGSEEGDVGDGDGDDDDDEIEIVDDEETPDEEEETPPSHSLAEGKKNKVLAENQSLKVQLNETQLLMARSLYVNKLFARDNLSGDQKRKIVEYLDSARTIQEAKDVYGRIKNILDGSSGSVNESKKTAKTGSGSANTRSGGLRSLNESNTNVRNWSFDTSRWAHLAGITKKST